MKPAIGIFGGSFDPVHIGHLWMAQAGLERLPIDHVRWIPAATSPLKKNGPVASNSQRLTMLQLALSGVPGHVIDTRELERDGISFTVDTLAELHHEFPEHSLYLIIGADSLFLFDEWKDPERILQMATLSVIARGGLPPPDYDVLNEFASKERVTQCLDAEIAMSQIEISSSDLRERVKRFESLRFQVPAAVDAFIRNEGLYTE